MHVHRRLSCDGKLEGIVHYLFHRSTWMTGDYCYLQDLFVAETRRNHGLGRTLIEAVYAKAREAGVGRRLLADARDQRDRARALRQGRRARRLHPVSQDAVMPRGENRVCQRCWFPDHARAPRIAAGSAAMRRPRSRLMSRRCSGWSTKPPTAPRVSTAGRSTSSATRPGRPPRSSPIRRRSRTKRSWSAAAIGRPRSARSARARPSCWSTSWRSTSPTPKPDYDKPQYAAAMARCEKLMDLKPLKSVIRGTD